ncbi:ABC transporter substrate-binding protein [Shewanella sp. Isolate11]|uniref:substrate-binding periplasmic protein n=1 Tax=Shewanella sp. Isolate11 TaxID=2908530 RepID=UPI001EFE5E9B|nr:ABC transporter substrate-binding protein [Shewanella sp. Isolate11]MCG9697734.1 transporter substrate-binding domain-containing protein [Shewanella sp. Isolate11]
MKYLTLCFLLLLLIIPLGKANASLRILTEEWAPISFQDHGVPQGYGVKLVQQLAHQLDVDADIEVLPWARAYSIASSEPNVMLFPMSDNAERSRLFDFVGPIATATINIYAHADDDVEIEDLSQLDELGSVGVYRGAIGQSMLTDAGVKHLTVASMPQHSAKQLLHKRIRFWCQADLAVVSLLDDVSAGVEQIKPVYELAKIDLYLAFSKGTDPKVVRQWHNALQQLESQGELARLFEAWIPDDYEPNEIEHIELAD